ncbi:MAG: (d)CMP kinase [Desulfovibrionaceae bacterium]
MRKYVITIDGTSGVGKSTLTKRLSILYAIPYLDTGAMFRSLAHTFTQMYPTKNHTDITSKIMSEIIHNASFTLLYTNGSTQLLYNGQPLHPLIRTEEVARITAYIARLQEVRTMLQREQHKLANTSSLIAEGRDTGTVVFPNATCKFFLTATAEERARRRYHELTVQDKTLSYETVLSQIQARDLLDTTRTLSPLIPANDAHSIDTTEYTLPNLIEHVQSILSTHDIYPHNNT